MYAAIQLVGYRLVVVVLVPLAVAVPVTPTAAPAATTAALPSAAATTAAALFGPIAALAVDRPVPAGFEWDGRGLSAARAHYRCARAHAGAPCAVAAAFVLGMGGSVAASATRALLGLATGFAAPGRGVPAFLKELLFTSGEHKFLTAVATSK
jgi:hypothetical protein